MFQADIQTIRSSLNKKIKLLEFYSNISVGRQIYTVFQNMTASLCLKNNGTTSKIKFFQNTCLNETLSVNSTGCQFLSEDFFQLKVSISQHTQADFDTNLKNVFKVFQDVSPDWNSSHNFQPCLQKISQVEHLIDSVGKFLNISIKLGSFFNVTEALSSAEEFDELCMTFPKPQQFYLELDSDLNQMCGPASNAFGPTITQGKEALEELDNTFRNFYSKGAEKLLSVQTSLSLLNRNLLQHIASRVQSYLKGNLTKMEMAQEHKSWFIQIGLTDLELKFRSLARDVDQFNQLTKETAVTYAKQFKKMASSNFPLLPSSILQDTLQLGEQNSFPHKQNVTLTKKGSVNQDTNHHNILTNLQSNDPFHNLALHILARFKHDEMYHIADNMELGTQLTTAANALVQHLDFFLKTAELEYSFYM